MAKISVDLHPKIKKETFFDVINGCMQVLDILDDSIVKTIEVFKIKPTKLRNFYGPGIKIYFKFPTGKSASHETDFRFLGNDGSYELTSDSVANRLCQEIQDFIKLFLDEIEQNVEEAQKLATSIKKAIS